jgi:hypothetical protein
MEGEALSHKTTETSDYHLMELGILNGEDLLSSPSTFLVRYSIFNIPKLPLFKGETLFIPLFKRGR